MDFSKHLQSLLDRDPFDPFRIKLLNGDAHDVAYLLSIALLSDGVYIALFDGHWVQFPYDRIASFESLIQLA